MEYLSSNVSLKKVRGRDHAFTINQLFEIPIGTDLASLHALGSKGIDSYVLSGFKTLPPRVILRTDFKQAEVETLNKETINILLENVET